MGTKLNPGKFDCYTNALPDEPMFVLLARDEQAPERVRDWANRYKQIKESNNNDCRMTIEQYSKWLEAMHCVDQMTEWNNYHNQKRIVKTLAPNASI